MQNKKKIIVTGAAGFIGKNLVLRLLKENYYVLSVDYKNPNIKNKNHKFHKSSIKRFFYKKKIYMLLFI